MDENLREGVDLGNNDVWRGYMAGWNRKGDCERIESAGTYKALQFWYNKAKDLEKRVKELEKQVEPVR